MPIGLDNQLTYKILIDIANHADRTDRAIARRLGVKHQGRVNRHVHWLFDNGYVQIANGKSNARVLTHKAKQLLAYRRIDGRRKAVGVIRWY